MEILAHKSSFITFILFQTHINIYFVKVIKKTVKNAAQITILVRKTCVKQIEVGRGP